MSHFRSAMLRLAACCAVYGVSVEPVAAGSFTALHQFTGGADGNWPSGVTVANGIVYGETLYGGAACPPLTGGSFGCGVVFSVQPGGQFTVLHDFSAATGGVGNGPPVISGGKLYGTADAGGGHGDGVVFQLGTDGSNYTILHQFSGKDGNFPSGPIVVGSQGRIFGTTESGGNGDGNGVLYQLSPDGTFKVLHKFDRTGEGKRPQGVLADRMGDIYGTVRDSVSYCAVVYRYAPATGMFSIIHQFAGAGCVAQIGSISPTGEVFGALNTKNGGVLFTLQPQATGWSYSQFHAFADSRVSNFGVPVATAGGLVTGIAGFTAVGSSEPHHFLYHIHGGTLTPLYDLTAADTADLDVPVIVKGGTIFGFEGGNNGTCPCGTVYSYTP